MRAEVIATRDGGDMQATVAPLPACFDAKGCVARWASKSQAMTYRKIYVKSLCFLVWRYETDNVERKKEKI
jgi:hypothetical protein